MEIKGNIGEEVMVKAVIESVTVYKNETVYRLDINDGEGHVNVSEDEITFITKEKKPRAEKKPKAPKKEEKAAAPETPKRRPGRPKKATVEGTMRKYEEMMARNEVSLDDGIDG